MNFHSALPIGKNGAEQAARAGASQEVLLIGRFVVGIARRKHHAFHAERHHLIEETAHALRVRAIEKRGIGGDPETLRHCFANAIDRQFETAFLADGEIVVLFFPIHMHGKRQVFTRLEKVQLLFEQQGVGAEINVFLPRDQPFDNLVDFRVHQRLAAGDRYHRRAAFIHRLEALFRSHVHLENMGRILDLPAARARQIAAEQRFQHQDERILPCFRPCAGGEHSSPPSTSVKSVYP